MKIKRTNLAFLISLCLFASGAASAAQNNAVNYIGLNISGLKFNSGSSTYQNGAAPGNTEHQNGVAISALDLTYGRFDKVIASSTTNFYNRNLSNAVFSDAILKGTSFSLANLKGADFSNADLTNANLAGAYFDADTNLSGAIVKGANFDEATPNGFTAEHLYSTKSYEDKDLGGISMFANDIRGWNFEGINLSKAYFGYADFDADTNFSGAIITGANFERATETGLTASHIYATKSYVDKDLNGIKMSFNDLSAWNFEGINLTKSDFRSANVTGTNFTSADFRGATNLATMTGAYTTKNTIWSDGIVRTNGVAGAELNSSDDYILVRKYAGANARISQETIAAGNSRIILESGGVLEVADLTVQDATIQFHAASTSENGKIILKTGDYLDITSDATIEIVLGDEFKNIAGDYEIILIESIAGSSLSIDENTSVIFKWENNDGHDLSGWKAQLIDGVGYVASYSAIPEPSEIAALIGLFALGFVIRKNKNHKTK